MDGDWNWKTSERAERGNTVPVIGSGREAEEY
jgi:hypothetical protein